MAKCNYKKTLFVMFVFLYYGYTVVCKFTRIIGALDSEKVIFIRVYIFYNQ